MLFTHHHHPHNHHHDDYHHPHNHHHHHNPHNHHHHHHHTYPPRRLVRKAFRMLFPLKMMLLNNMRKAAEGFRDAAQFTSATITEDDKLDAEGDDMEGAW